MPIEDGEPVFDATADDDDQDAAQSLSEMMSRDWLRDEIEDARGSTMTTRFTARGDW